jgi:predicted O-methyltransferase YrrM
MTMKPWDRVMQIACDLRDEEFLVYGIEELSTNYLNHYWEFGSVYKPDRILETGVRFGYTAMMLLDGSGADFYMGVDIDGERLGAAQKLIGEFAPDAELELICEDVRNWKPDGLEGFDLIHLDAYHEDVKVELELADKLVEVGGVVIVDDVREAWVWEPVVEFFTERDYAMSHVKSLTGQLIGVKQ